MEAGRNLANVVVLGCWALVGLAFSFHAAFGASASLATLASAGAWWLWFAGFAALASWLVSTRRSAFGALGVHVAMVLGLLCLPAIGPFALLRYGLDAVRA
jgi:hypothetical protein